MGGSQQHGDGGRVPSLCAFYAREAEPSGAAKSGLSFGPGRCRSFCEILFDVIDGGERWRAAAVAAASELGGTLRQHGDRNRRPARHFNYRGRS